MADNLGDAYRREARSSQQWVMLCGLDVFCMLNPVFLKLCTIVWFLLLRVSVPREKLDKCMHN
jgi:hypothetical protein